MKKFAFLISLLMGLIMVGCSSSEVSHDATKLPKKAQTILEQNFGSAVSLVETEKKFGSVDEYEVTLSDGSEISFNGSGEWKSIDTPVNKAVPAGLVPTAISNYVKQKFSGALIVGIEKEKKGFEVELSNGVELHFSQTGSILSSN